VPRLIIPLIVTLAVLLPRGTTQNSAVQKPVLPRDQTATPIERIKTIADFRVELLYSVPKATQGSWVSMCVDPQGRLIVADQGSAGLFRVTPPAPGGKPSATKVEKIPVVIGEAQGLLWAFDSLYVVVNGKKHTSGLYRIRDTDGDGELDEVKLLRKLSGNGTEHGPHAVVLAPDGKSLYVVCGNASKLTEIAGSRVPRIWGEDHLLPRMPDARGFMRNVLAPGGCVYQTDPLGGDWQLVSVGYRNPYDMAFNRHGDLFTFDADMEWDFNTPWYRPTRVCLATSGSEFGWRNGTGKYPPHYPDNLPAVCDIGPGSPTGVTFGYGAKFPAKYQEALFICDWSYGKLYAVHVTPNQSGYRGEVEEFLSGLPLPLTDIVVHPKDGALYFAIGGRGTQSGLYRLTYIGKESTAPSKSDNRGEEFRALRRKLEALHGRQDPKTVEIAWPFLGHADRYLRFAARVALEHQNPATWRERALQERHPVAAVHALLALARVSAPDPFHRKPDDPPADPKLRERIIDALGRIGWDGLEDAQRLELLRVYQISFNRLGKPSPAEREQVIARLDPHYPARDRFINADLCQVLVYLEAPGVAAKTLELLKRAPTQEEQIEYAKSLRVLKAGWTLEQRRHYFSWFNQAGSYRGGASFQGYVGNIKLEALAELSDADKLALKPILDTKVDPSKAIVTKSRPFVKKWTVEELAPSVDKGLTKRDFERGRALFGATSCFACHRFGNDGGAMGPDLTGAAGRFSVRDLLESIIEPNKVISDQYAAVVITTIDGKVVTGRIINMRDDTWHINVDMLNPSAKVGVNRKLIESMHTSKVSMMPAGLLDTLERDEIQDLMAFLLSRGDRKNAMFR
jgi:putative heme-binding domain-containing protein